MGFDSFGAPQFGINDAKVAAYNATNDYGTAVDIPSIQMLQTDIRILSGELEGDDQITDSHGQVIGARVRMRFGSMSIAALEVLLGLSSSASGSTPNQVDQLKVSGGDNMPYVGIVGKIAATQGTDTGSDTQVFIPKCKITGDFTLIQAEYGQYTIPEVEVTAVDDATYGVALTIEQETGVAVAVPPTNVQ